MHHKQKYCTWCCHNCTCFPSGFSLLWSALPRGASKVLGLSKLSCQTGAFDKCRVMLWQKKDGTLNLPSWSRLCVWALTGSDMVIQVYTLATYPSHLAEDILKCTSPGAPRVPPFQRFCESIIVNNSSVLSIGPSADSQLRIAERRRCSCSPRQGMRTETMTAVAGVKGFDGNWCPGPAVGWAMPRYTTCWSSSACWRVAGEGYARLTEVLATGAVDRTWVGLYISG